MPHTPGNRYIVKRGDGSYEVGYGAPNAENGALVNGPDALGNARLDAAAPDLLEALKHAVARVELANSEGDPILSAWLTQARAAIAKATGN